MQSFPEQVTTEINLMTVFYWVATLLIIAGIAGNIFLESGLARRKNALNIVIEKFTMLGISLFGFLIVGYGIWMSQYYAALGVPDAFWSAIKDWWIFGPALRTPAAFLDPKFFPEADTFQVFSIFFALFAAITLAYLPGAALERIKPLPMYIITFVASALVFPFIAFMSWGSTGWLSNLGVHEFGGVFPFHILVGSWGLVLAWRIGPRLGHREAHPKTVGPLPHDLRTAGFGIMMIMIAIAAYLPGCGWLIPKLGYFGITMTNSGFGVVFVNLFIAFAAGALGGAVITYRDRNPLWVMAGPIMGFLAIVAFADIAQPWEAALAAFVGPFVSYGFFWILAKLGIDDPKVSPLHLAVGVFSALVAGFVGWGVQQGGYPGAVAGYDLGHATITPWTQAFGTVVVLAFALGSAFVTIYAVEKIFGLRVSEEEEIEGLDKKWVLPAYTDEAAVIASASKSSAAGSEPSPAPAPGS